MLAEWSAECGQDDPVLVVPWRDPAGAAQFIDLRSDPYDAYSIPEAESHPSLLQALRALNAARSPVFTAKCDVWMQEGEELENLRLHLELENAAAANGMSAYIDVLWREWAIFASRHRQEQMLDRLVRLLAELPSTMAAVECVLRPAVQDFGEAREGFAVSIYVKAVGTDPIHAQDEWGRALDLLVKVLRGRDFGPR